MTADSSLVVRGTIVELSAMKDPDRGLWYRVTFRVDETLKGPHGPTVGFVLQQSRSDDETVERWHERGQMLLAFLEESRYLVALDSPKYARFAFAPRTGRREGSIVELNRVGEPQVFSMAPRALSEQEDIAQAAKDAIAGSPALWKLSSHRVTLPNDIVKRTPWAQYPLTGGSVFLNVPIDSRLEGWARAWIRSRDKMMRREGAAALIYFKSGDNEELLKGMLDDPGTWERTIWEGGRIAGRERVYQVREAAYAVLEAWGCEVHQPVLKEPLSPQGC